MMQTIWKEFTFEAAHRLPNVAPGHKCGRLHGHSFHAKVYIAGQVDPRTGWVMDFADIKDVWLNNVHAVLDHNYINDTIENPTSENIAEWLWRQLAPLLLGLKMVEVSETCTSGAVYTGPDEA